MKLDIDNKSIHIPCQGCGHKIPQTFGRIKANNQITCPVCGSVTTIKLEELDAAIKEIEKQLDAIRAKFKKAFK